MKLDGTLRSPSEDKYGIKQRFATDSRRNVTIVIIIAALALSIWYVYLYSTDGSTAMRLRRKDDINLRLDKKLLFTNTVTLPMKSSVSSSISQKTKEILDQQPQIPPPVQLQAHTFPPISSIVSSVLIVLGNEPLDDQTPTVDTKNRVQKAVEYYFAHPESTLLIFTGGPTAGKKTEALMMSEYAQSLGVPVAAIRLEEKARSTKQNAVLSAKLLLKENIRPRTVFVVSKADHLTWAMGLFKAKDVPQVLFATAQALPCVVDRADVMRQMEVYIETHPDHSSRVQMRLEMLKKGVQGID